MSEDVQVELERLRGKLEELEAKQSISKVQPQVYIRPEKKMPKLAGRPVKETDPDVDDWISDVKQHIASIPTEAGKIEFVVDHLTGGAKLEVRLRPAEMKETADDILAILEDTYKIQDTLAQLRHKFYERSQQEGESLESYSQALMKMLFKISKKEGVDLPNKDKTLIEKFIDGIRDPQLKRELRKFGLENPGIPFVEFRRTMLMWVDDQQDKPDKSFAVREISVKGKPEFEELADLVKKQQEMLEKQQLQIERLTMLTRSDRFNKRGTFSGRRGRGRGFNYNPRFAEKPDKKIICYNCKKEGHKRNECPELKQETTTKKSPNTNNPKGGPSQ